MVLVLPASSAPRTVEVEAAQGSVLRVAAWLSIASLLLAIAATVVYVAVRRPAD